jgi:C4-dicarboxylate-specific signal transduction histidine kinase
MQWSTAALREKSGRDGAMGSYWRFKTMESVNFDRWRGPSAVGYGLAVLAVTAATIIQHFGDMHFAVTPSFVCAVLLSAWFGGLGPGLLATALSLLALKYYFVPPVTTFTIDAAYIPSIVLFALAALFVTWLSARERSSAKSLVYARDQLDLKLDELEKSNASLQVEMAARARAEEKLDELRSELAHINRIMTLGELAASIAHEINQPLGAIVLDSDVGARWLGRSPPDLNKAREAFARINGDVRRATDVIDRIRALAKKSSIQMTQIDVNEVINSVVAVTRNEIERNRIALRTDLDEDLPAVRGDRVQLQQVFLNLIMNAVEAMAPGESRNLMVCSRSPGPQNVLVSVCDSGPGLEDQKVNRLFEAFYTTKPNGMGMGLAICQSIMETHRGRLLVRANEPRGAIFEVDLPIQQAGAVAPA